VVLKVATQVTQVKVLLLQKTPTELQAEVLLHRTAQERRE